MLMLRALAVVTPLLGSIQAQAPTGLPEDRAAGAATISAEDLEAWLTTLTSAEFAGRGTGAPGFELAARFVESHFKAAGLEPAPGMKGYLQPVPWVRRTIDTKDTSIRISRDGRIMYEIDASQGLAATGTLDSNSEMPLAIALFTGKTDELAKSEFEGRFVLVIAEQPVDGLRGYYRISRAVRNGGGTLLAVADSELHASVPSGGTTMPNAPGNRAATARSGRPRIFVLNRASADDLLRSCAVTEPELSDRRVVRVDGAVATAQLVTVEEPAPAYNVVGVLRGSDPDLRDEYVMIGSHLDHLGKRGDTFWPGADDDGSGTVGVLALARAFTANPERPRRSLVFATFCGEERGLIGSAYFAANPPVQLESITAELQVDMIGRSEEHPRSGESADQNRNCLHLIGSEKLSSDLHEVCLRLNQQRAGFDLEWDEEDVFYRSDHWNFAREGVPVAFFFTGFHADYHKPTDTVDKIEFDKLARIATYVYDIAFELAEADERPLVDAAKWTALEKKGRREPVAPVRQE